MRELKDRNLILYLLKKSINFIRSTYRKLINKYMITLKFQTVNQLNLKKDFFYYKQDDTSLTETNHNIKKQD